MGHRSFLQMGMGLGALFSVGLLGYACSSSSDSGNTGGAAGTSTAGTGGSATGTGGSGAGTGGSATGTGGSGTGTGGTVTTGDAGDMPPVGPCLNGEAKNGACTTATPEGMSCYNTCGPDSVGYKLETCTGGLYVEGMCAYLQSKNYSCYKIPAAVPACPTNAGMMTASQVCTTPMCMPCGPNYGDSTGASKVGYCVCNAGGKWTCGSTSSNSWPCSAPGGANTNPGCQ